MVFSSITFLCLFFPIVYLVHLIVPTIKLKNVILIIASLVFYAWGEPIYIFLMIISVFVNWLFGKGLVKFKQREKLILVLTVIFNIGLLTVFKYAGFLIELLNLISPIQLPIPEIRLPIGISFFTFQAMSYVIDVKRDNSQLQHNFFNLLLYISFFPQLIAGPIVKYHDISSQINDRKLNLDDTVVGLRRFLFGLSKKLLISNCMATVVDSIYDTNISALSTSVAWIGAIAYLLQIYFDFSGYSDMAIGLSAMFGFKLLENFNYPYYSLGIQDFWRRWHISLSTWFKEYLYIPLGGNRKGKARTYFNKLIVFVATGIWHGANLTFLVWGLYNGALIIIEGLASKPLKRLDKNVGFSVFHRLLTLFAVTVGFVIFRADTLGIAVSYLKSMFIPTGVFIDAIEYLTPYCLSIFAFAFVFSFPVLPVLKSKICKHQALLTPMQVCGFVVSVFLLLLCVILLASDAYNPFIYFRF